MLKKIMNKHPYWAVTSDKQLVTVTIDDPHTKVLNAQLKAAVLDARRNTKARALKVRVKLRTDGQDQLFIARLDQLFASEQAADNSVKNKRQQHREQLRRMQTKIDDVNTTMGMLKLLTEAQRLEVFRQLIITGAGGQIRNAMLYTQTHGGADALDCNTKNGVPVWVCADKQKEGN